MAEVASDGPALAHLILRFKRDLALGFRSWLQSFASAKAVTEAEEIVIRRPHILLQLGSHGPMPAGRSRQTDQLTTPLYIPTQSS